MEIAFDKSGAAPSVSVTTLDLDRSEMPLPVLKARRQISKMAAGERLDVMADDRQRRWTLNISAVPAGMHLSREAESSRSASVFGASPAA